MTEQAKTPTVSNPVEAVVSGNYESLECTYCETVIIYEDADIFTMCDTVNGQYIEYDAVYCKECDCHNRTW